MAFKARCEYYNLSMEGVGTVILDEAIDDADEYTTTQSAIALPDTSGAYAMCVTSLTGACTVEVSANPVGTASRGKVITEGKDHWFLVKKNDKLTIQEYAMP